MKNGLRSRGFTLVEVLVGAVLLMLLVGGMFTVLRTGSRVSLKGMTRIETTLEGYRLLQTVQTDLQQACFVLRQKRDANSLPTISNVIQANPERTEFTWLAFPRLGGDQEVVAGADDKARHAPRLASRITYRKAKTEGDPAGFDTLTREEVFHPSHPEAARHPGGKVVHVLSRRVYHFDIRPRTAQQQGVDCWWVYFVLVDYPGVSREARTTDPDAMTSGNLVKADFFTVAASDFFNRFWTYDRVNGNWQAEIHGPDPASSAP